MDKLTEEEIKVFESCKTLPPEFAEATDFKAEEAIKLDYSIGLPESYSLGKWIYKTSNQGGLGSCTSLGTTHGVQILNVKKGGVEPTDRNIITPLRKDLRSKMGHSTTEYDGGDYVEKAVSTALKEGILIEENGQLARFDAYATDEFTRDEKGFDKMKRYLYQGCPIIWCIKGNAKMWNEMLEGEIKTVPSSIPGGHCIALVGWDKGGMWFVNSRKPNDGKGLKCRFYITYDMIKKLGWLLNYRYWVLYMKESQAKDAEYLKRKNVYLEVLKTLKKYYPVEKSEIQKGIEAFSSSVRKFYSELNEELPK